MQTMTEIQTAAQQLHDAFVKDMRFDKTGLFQGDFYRLADDSPEWMRDVIRDAHGTEMLPDDWRYETIMYAAEAIAEQDDPDEGAHGFADRRVYFYTADRLAWLASNTNRANYCDVAVDEGLFTFDEGRGIVDLIGAGQYEEASEVFHGLRQALETFTSAP
jgi:hypothetical protein